MSSVKENHHDHGKHHIVLVHGACHGAWSWYKVKLQLEAVGHRITALDLAASGTNLKEIQDVYSMKDYSQPLLELMETIGPNDQKVMLVGHSLGGLNLALAMDMFPEKIAAAVFLTAFMPDTVHRPSYILDQENHHDHGKHHIVLVHGACHGAWSWYKVKPRLEAVGHRVTALDLAASGTNLKAIQDVYSMKDYSQPLLELMETLGPNDQKVMLVGHSLGGLNLALAMDMFPEKIAAAVFLTAFMPDTVHRPSYVLDQYCERIPSDSWLDTKFGTYQTPNGPIASMFFGPKFLSSKLYQLSPTEDLELANTLARPGSLFIEDLSKANKFSAEGFGSIPRVYVVCDEDKAIPVEFQRWMIGNNDVSDMVEICGADHMPMFSKPQELCDSLVKIAHKYA